MLGHCPTEVKIIPALDRVAKIPQASTKGLTSMKRYALGVAAAVVSIAATETKPGDVTEARVIAEASAGDNWLVADALSMSSISAL
jgi:hypothetical protein